MRASTAYSTGSAGTPRMCAYSRIRVSLGCACQNTCGMFSPVSVFGSGASGSGSLVGHVGSPTSCGGLPPQHRLFSARVGLPSTMRTAPNNSR